MHLRIFFLALSGLLVLPNFFDFSIESKPLYNKQELYDANLTYLNSLDKLIQHADSLAIKKNIQQHTAEYGVMIANVIRKRFYHGFSVYKLSENWLASVAQVYLGGNLANPVDPEDILQYPFAGCSQQAIVLMKAMERKKVSYRSIGFPHHYATELLFGGTWYFFDTDMEPAMRLADRREKSWEKSPEKLKKYYKLSMAELNWGLGSSDTLQIGNSNDEPAPNAKFFQYATKILSKTLWMIPLMMAFSIQLVKNPVSRIS